jgi:hypothetical protein
LVFLVSEERILMKKRFFMPGPVLRAVVIATALVALAGCPGAGPDTSRSLASIAITSEPARTMYVKGEALDLAGLEVTATWSDGATSVVDVTEDHISFDSEAVGNVDVAVTVQDKKAFFAITVTDPVAEALAFWEAHAAVLLLSPSSITPEIAAEYEAGVDAALAAYHDLSEGAQALATAQKATLDALKSRIDELLAPGRAEAFRAAHKAVLALTLDTVTPNHEAAIDAALAAYGGLNEAAGALLAAEKTLLDSLKQRAGGLKEKTAFITAHAAILSLTAKTVSPDDEAAVDAALAAFTELSERAQALAAAEKALLDNFKITIADLRAAEGADEADKAAAAAFVSAHEAILGKTADAIAVADEPSVDAALAAYDALTPQVKALVGARKALLDSFKTKITDTKTAAAFRTEHSAVLNKNPSSAAIADEAAVDAIIAAWDALSPGAKELLAPEKAALDALKQSITTLKEAAADRIAAEAFKKDHAAVLGKTTGSITAGDEPLVDAALAAYNVLGSPAKTLLAEQKTLLDSLKEKIDEYNAPAAAAEFRANHAGVLGKTLDNITVGDEAGVNAALLAWNSLSSTARTLAAVEKALLDSLKQKITAFKDAAAEQDARDNIRSAADLAKIGVDPAYPADGSYTLMADLVLNDWTPLCPDGTNPFSGTFNGNGHTITITGFNNAAVQGNTYIGIFGYVKGASSSTKALIRNMRVVSSVDASSTRDGGQSIGLIAGYANRAVIEAITLEGNLRFSALIGVVYVGGAAGWIEQEAVVRNCNSSMNLQITGGYDVPLDPNTVVYSSIGGFVGLFKYNSEIRDCHNTGNINGGAARPSADLVNSRGSAGDGSTGGATTNDPNHAQAFVGGIAGGSYFGFDAGESGGIYNCTSYGDIYAGAGGWWAFAAGISGCFQGAMRMEYCVAGGTLRATSQYAYVGGMTAYGDNDAVFYRCSFVGAIAPFTYYTYGPITGQYGSVIECEWSTPAPEATINLDEKLDGLTANTQYMVNGVSKTADASGKIPIEEAWFGSTINIKRDSQIDSLALMLTISPRPAAPTGLSAGSASISGINASMEWAPFGAVGWDNAAWTSCVGNSIAGLAPGTYYVRYKHTATAFASANAVVTVSLSIMSAADLAKIGADPAYPVNGAYNLGADITLSNWAPLEFNGSFNGNDHRITIDSFNQMAVIELNSIGIFSSITGPSYDVPVVIENLNISISGGAYASIDGLAANNIVGTIAGAVEFVMLSNIHVDGAAIAFKANEDSSHTTLVGGIVGISTSSVIKGCSNSAAITVGASVVGGIAGSVVSPNGMNTNPIPSIVDACYATGAITTSSADSVRACVGGIVGSVSSDNTVKRSYFTGSLTVARGNDWSVTENESSMTGVGGIVGMVLNAAVIEDCHSSGVFAGTSTNTPGGNNAGMALGGIVGLHWGSGGIIQRCHSVVELNVQRNSKAYTGGIIGYNYHVSLTPALVRITACVALNVGMTLEYSFGGAFGLHRILGERNGEKIDHDNSVLLSRNIAWASMPLATTQTGQVAQPFTEAPEDMVRTGVAGEDCDQKPTQSDYTALGWDFGTVWKMGGNGYPELK